MKVTFATTLTFLDTPADDTVIDVLAIPEGWVVYDIHLNVISAWDNGGYLRPGFNLNTSTPLWCLGNFYGDPTMSIGYGNDSPVISGNIDASDPSSVFMKATQFGGPYLPTIALADTVLQVSYTSFGGDAPTTGEVEIRVVLEEGPLPTPTAPDPPPPGDLTFPGDDHNFEYPGTHANALAYFHSARPMTVTVTLDADLGTGTDWTIGVSDPSGLSVGVSLDQPATAGDHTFTDISAGDWVIYALSQTTFDYDGTLTGSGGYSVTYP